MARSLRACGKAGGAIGHKNTLGAGPGWCSSGGPWVTPGEPMKHLVYSETEVSGGKKVSVKLPVPEQRSTQWHNLKDPYYQDVAVYAIPNSVKPSINDINEKVLFERDPYSSKPNVKPFLPDVVGYKEVSNNKVLNHEDVIDVTGYLKSNGRLVWKAPYQLYRYFIGKNSSKKRRRWLDRFSYG